MTFPPNFVWNKYTAGKWEAKETFCQNSLMHLFNGDRPIVQWILAWKTGSQGGFLLWSLINCKEATLKTVRTSKVDSKTSQWYCPGSKVCVSLGTRPAWLPWEQTNYWLPCTLDTGGQSHNRTDAHLMFWHLFKERILHLSCFLLCWL